jgi:hypothetical protein
MRWLAYLHPAMMILVLSLGVFVFREGLQIRRARLQGLAFNTRRHRRLARVFAVLIVVGFGAGLASMGWLRGKPVLDSFHALLALAAGSGLLLAAALGLRLERGAEPPTRTLHALFGAVGLLLALTAAVAGFSILP